MDLPNGSGSGSSIKPWKSLTMNEEEQQQPLNVFQVLSPGNTVWRLEFVVFRMSIPIQILTTAVQRKPQNKTKSFYNKKEGRKEGSPK